MSTAKKPTRSHHAATFEQKPHAAAKAEEAPVVDVPVEQEAAPEVAPPAVEPVAEPPVDAAKPK